MPEEKPEERDKKEGAEEEIFSHTFKKACVLPL